MLTLFLIIGVPFFMGNDSKEMIRSLDKYLVPIILFNLSTFLFFSALILFFVPFLENEDNIINLELPSHVKSKVGTISLGRILKRNKKRNPFYLSMNDLEKHMFVCGATGTGKSNFIQNFLLNFTNRHKLPFLLVEFKGEYHFLQRIIENFVIIRPGENFAINIFNPEGSVPEIHAERIFDILKSGQFLDANEFSPQMQKVLVEILTILCRNKHLQSWDGFYRYCDTYAKKYAKNIPMLSQTLISIKNRIRRFSLGSLKALFDAEHKIKTKDLFERNVLIDLSSIIRLGGEKADALFFLNMVLKYLWDRNITRGAYKFKGIKHITIIEDAQYFVPKDLTKQTKLSTYLEDIALLQRGTGECLISIATHPEISREILANCGALIVFKTHMQREFLCELLNLDKEKQEYLSILEEGQCLARVNSIKEPFLLSIPFIKRESLEMSEINRNNKISLSNDKISNILEFQCKRLIEEKKNRISTSFKSLISKINGRDKKVDTLKKGRNRNIKSLKINNSEYGSLKDNSDLMEKDFCIDNYTELNRSQLLKKEISQKNSSLKTKAEVAETPVTFDSEQEDLEHLKACVNDLLSSQKRNE